MTFQKLQRAQLDLVAVELPKAWPKACVQQETTFTSVTVSINSCGPYYIGEAMMRQFAKQIERKIGQANQNLSRCGCGTNGLRVSIFRVDMSSVGVIRDCDCCFEAADKQACGDAPSRGRGHGQVAVCGASPKGRQAVADP